MDTVFFEALSLRAVIGVHAWERAFAQRLELDLDLAVDTTQAAATDAIDAAVDYAALSDRLTQSAAASDCQLIETLADRLAGVVLEDGRIARVELTLRKPGAVPAARNVGVRITRSQSEVP
jgi:dihydroneopterin aldolase